MAPSIPVMTVVIPTLGTSPHLRGLLERLQRQTASFTFQVLVVANIPSQALRKLVNSMGDARKKNQKQFEYLETGRLGVNLARNKGLERAAGSIVLFLDDDTILETDSFISAHFERHQFYPDAVAIGGPYHLTATRSSWDEAYQNIAHDWLDRRMMSHHRTTQLLGGNMSLKKDILHQRDWRFDDLIGFGGAESGLCSRIAAAGLPLLFFRDLSVGHSPQMNRLTFCKKAFLQGAGARWRTGEIPEIEMKFVNEFRPSAKLTSAEKLYRSCFNFGWKTAPYDPKKTSNAKRALNPTFNVPKYLVFRIRDLKPWRALRNWHRESYAQLRTAWINAREL